MGALARGGEILTGLEGEGDWGGGPDRVRVEGVLELTPLFPYVFKPV